MSEYVIKKITYRGCVIKIIQDPDAENPREAWDNVGTMLCKHRRYNLGDGFKNGRGTQPTAEEIIDITKRPDVIWLPLYLYDHSGITISCGSPRMGEDDESWMNSKGRFVGDDAGWDTSTIGIIYCTKEKAIKEWGKKKFTKQVYKKAVNYLKGEVKTYDDYLTGNVAGFVAETSDGEEISSCWGFYPDAYPKEWDYPISEAKSAIDHWLKDNSGASITLWKTTAGLGLCTSKKGGK